MADLPDPLPRNRRSDAFERRFAGSLEGRVAPGEPLVVACSGGPDSVATAVAAGRSLPSSNLAVAHFDHGLRPIADTEADAAFVEALATRLGASFALGRPDAALSGDEAGARDARYAWLATVLAETGSHSLLTGHTQDDQAETVLLNLARGTGLRGAGGMRTESGWPVPGEATSDLRVLRPLLGRTRAEVEDYVGVLGIEPRLDPTNELGTYARNRVRLEVLPALESVNPRARHHLAAFAERAAQADEALDDWAGAEFEANATVDAACVRIDRVRFRMLPPAVAHRLLRLAAERVGLELDAAQQAQLLEIASRRGARADLAGGQGWTDERSLVLRPGEGLDTAPGTA